MEKIEKWKKLRNEKKTYEVRYIKFCITCFSFGHVVLLVGHVVPAGGVFSINSRIHKKEFAAAFARIQAACVGFIAQSCTNSRKKKWYSISLQFFSHLKNGNAKG